MSSDAAPSVPPIPVHPAGPLPGRYRHYKGKDYLVLGVAKHSETEEELVTYRLLYGDYGLWVRPAPCSSKPSKSTDASNLASPTSAPPDAPPDPWL